MLPIPLCVPLRPVYTDKVPTMCQPTYPAQAPHQQSLPSRPLPRPPEQHEEVSKTETVTLPGSGPVLVCGHQLAQGKAGLEHDSQPLYTAHPLPWAPVGPM